MRGTVAKRLRRMAERRTKGLPNRRYAKKNGGNVLIDCTRAEYLSLKAWWKQ